MFYLVVTGFKTEATAVLLPPRILPFGDEVPLSFTPTLENFREVFDRGFGPFVLHSVVAVGVSTAIVMALAIPCAFALVWRPGRRNQDVLFFFLSTKFLPAVGVIIPIFVIAGTGFDRQPPGAGDRVYRDESADRDLAFAVVLRRDPNGRDASGPR